MPLPALPVTILTDYLLPRRHAALILPLAVQDLKAKYRQSKLGLLWLFLTPLLMLLMYTLVFREVFQVRWAPADENIWAFALRIYAGLAVFNFFAEYVNRAPHLILEQPYLVKKILFPVQSLAWICLLSQLSTLLFSTLVLVALSLLGTGHLPLSVLALWLVWLPLVPLCLGLGWALSALGAYIRDIAQVLSMIMSALVFVSPVFFPAEALPRVARDWLWLNPLSLPMTQTRQVLIEGIWPDWSSWSINMAFALAVAFAGAWIFKKLRSGLADVL